VEDFFQLIGALERIERGNGIFHFRVLVALLGPGFHAPAEPGAEPRGANHARRVFDKTVIGDQAQLAVFEVGHAVQRVHQQPERAFVERDRHGVRRKVAASQIVENRGRFIDRLARPGERHRERRANLEPHAAGKVEEQRFRRLIFADKHAARLLQVLLELGRGALDGEVQVADGRAGGEVAHRAPHQEHSHCAGLSGLADGLESGLLRLVQSRLQQVNVVSHE
jgi:hypothetical protein